MSTESVKAFIKYISDPDNRELLISLDTVSSEEIPKVARKYGFEFEEEELVVVVNEIKNRHFETPPTVEKCRFLSAVANTKGWSCQ